MEISKILASDWMSFLTIKHITILIHTLHIVVLEFALVTKLTITILVVSADILLHFSEIVDFGGAQQC